MIKNIIVSFSIIKRIILSFNITRENLTVSFFIIKTEKIISFSTNKKELSVYKFNL